MSFSKNHAAEMSDITQGGVEGTQGTQHPPLELYSTPKTMGRHPIHNGTATCGAFIGSHSTSSQDLDMSRGVPGFDTWHREFPHWLSHTGFLLSRSKTCNRSKGAGMFSFMFSPLFNTSRTLQGPHQTTSSFPLCRHSGTYTHHRSPTSGTPTCRPICRNTYIWC